VWCLRSPLDYFALPEFSASARENPLIFKWNSAFVTLRKFEINFRDKAFVAVLKKHVQGTDR